MTIAFTVGYVVLVGAALTFNYCASVVNNRGRSRDE